MFFSSASAVAGLVSASRWRCVINEEGVRPCLFVESNKQWLSIDCEMAVEGRKLWRQANSQHECAPERASACTSAAAAVIVVVARSCSCARARAPSEHPIERRVGSVEASACR